MKKNSKELYLGASSLYIEFSTARNDHLLLRYNAIMYIHI